MDSKDEKNMKKTIKYLWASSYALLLLATAAFQGCAENPNDWPVEDVEPRLFMPAIFETSAIRATSVELKFTTILNAAEYILEFSRDSFATIDNTYKLLADTMTPFATSNDAMRTEYRYPFTGLFGTTDYDVRLQGRSANGLVSNYRVIEVMTAEENVFRRALLGLTSVRIQWEATPNVTNAVLYSVDGEGANANSAMDDELTELQRKSVVASDTQVEFTGLTPGATYQVIMWYGEDILRGRFKFTMPGESGVATYPVPDDATASKLATTLADYVTAGRTNVALVFEAGKTYAMGGDLVFPEGLNNVYFVGMEANDGTMPLLENIRFRLGSGRTIGNVGFSNLHMTGGGQMFFQADGGSTYANVTFNNCRIRQVNSVLRMYGGAIGGVASIYNCWISNTGGWGMINLGGDTGGMDRIMVRNSTLTDINTRFADVRIKTQLIFERITCVQINDAMGHLWLFDNKPETLSTVTIRNMIIGGPNKGTKLHSTNGNYATMPTYDGNYITSDLVQDTRPLTGISVLPVDIYGLFVDPDNGDFHIRKDAGFAGSGNSGDPRWYDE